MNFRQTLIVLCSTFFLYSNSQAQDTWSNSIASIVYQNCSSCHRTGSIAPFKLESYADFTANSISIELAVQDGKMPPWPPDPAYSRLSHERILSFSEKDKILGFINNGMPSGDLATAPSFPVFPSGSQVGTPDTVIQTSPYTATLNTDEYRNFTFSSNFNTTKKFRAIEFIPGNLQIVHHVLVFWDTTGICASLDAADPDPGYDGFGGVGTNDAQLIGAWVPGNVPFVLPDAFAYEIPANADFVLQFHYAPGSLGQTDSSVINLFYNTSPGFVRPVYFAAALNHFSNMTDGPLYIPANTMQTFHEEYTISGAFDLSLLGVSPHMHLIGKSIKSFGVKPGNDTVSFFNIPEWDFHWQGEYHFRSVIKIPVGTKLFAEAVYDNTSANPDNPNVPPLNVNAGEGTGDEMMIVFFLFTYYLPGDENMVLDTTALKAITYIPFRKSQNTETSIYPNPGNTFVTISWEVSETGKCAVSLVDITGKTVSVLLSETTLPHGSQKVEADLKNLPAGIYFLNISNNGVSETTGKLILSGQ